MLSFLCCLGKKSQWKNNQQDESEDVHEKKQPELTPDDIAAALQSRGWEASVVSSKDLGSLVVETKSSGILKCVDGRGASESLYNVIFLRCSIIPTLTLIPIPIDAIHNTYSIYDSFKHSNQDPTTDSSAAPSFPAESTP